MNETERDRQLDAAWSAASREEPPAPLDAAIRDAARRAIDAPPRRKRDKHWWYPLAAAATVAVLAVGIIQLTPPQQVAPTIVADMTAAPREANKDRAPSGASVDTKTVEPSAAITEPSPPATPSPSAQAPARRAQTAASGSLARERSPTPATERDASKQPVVAKRELAAQDKLASARSDKPAANIAPPSSAAAPASAAPPRSEPFPATAAPEPRREAYAEERNPAPNMPAKAAAPQVARSAAGPSAEEAQTRSRVAMAKVATTDEAKAKQVPARNLEEWIKRIRDLKNEGRLDEAAKELAAFRNEYGERADALLPADLRAMKAQPAK
ncbi:MAG: hypothetical protein AUH79_01400 [Betaproteobacteria bacterium 13_1_40CM_4_64_4]|nr:MAG: hypothetical protein AUH79_01400 [Betaproteobacteria bacterium 13_1_40CM_4_64_4]